MAEYIEREEVNALIKAECSPKVAAYLIDAVADIPAADVRPVVRARWRYKTMTVPGGKGQTYAKWCCTVCKGKAKERTNYCPNCGADMREA